MKGDLKARLREMRRSGEVKTGRQLAEAQQSSSMDLLFPGESREEETPFGRCYMRELHFPLQYLHGSRPLEGLIACDGSQLVLPARDQGLEQLKPESFLFLDIETTGLSGGSGTWAFLIGVGWLKGQIFQLRQYFLRRPAEERSMLTHFSALANRHPTLITFNGKMFDLPLIQTRQLLSGLKQTAPMQHLDLLQCARTLWRKRLASRSLRSLEENLLGITRDDDIPGSEIPAVYFNYLRRGETFRLKQVFDHNVLDILSMVTLTERIANLGSGNNIEHPAEALALGKLYLAAGQVAEGVNHLTAASTCRPDPLAAEAALELARHHKRQAQWSEALAIWQQLAGPGTEHLAALIELTKYYEHQAKDYQAALSAAESAFRMVCLSDYYCPRSETSPEAIEHRLNRLKRKLKSCR